jgi:hypothetical protein
MLDIKINNLHKILHRTLIISDADFERSGRNEQEWILQVFLLEVNPENTKYMPI